MRAESIAELGTLARVLRLQLLAVARVHRLLARRTRRQACQLVHAASKIEHFGLEVRVGGALFGSFLAVPADLRLQLLVLALDAGQSGHLALRRQDGSLHAR